MSQGKEFSLLLDIVSSQRLLGNTSFGNWNKSFPWRCNTFNASRPPKTCEGSSRSRLLSSSNIVKCVKPWKASLEKCEIRFVNNLTLWTFASTKEQFNGNVINSFSDISTSIDVAGQPTDTTDEEPRLLLLKPTVIIFRRLILNTFLGNWVIRLFLKYKYLRFVNARQQSLSTISILFDDKISWVSSVRKKKMHHSIWNLYR